MNSADSRSLRPDRVVRSVVQLEQPLIRCSGRLFLQLGNDRRSAWLVQCGVEGQRADGGWYVVEAQDVTPGLRRGPDGQILHVDVPELLSGVQERAPGSGRGEHHTFEEACAEVARQHELVTPLTVVQAAAMVGLTPDRFTSEMTRERTLRGRDYRVPRDQWRDGRSPLYNPALVREWDEGRPRRLARTK